MPQIDSRRATPFKIKPPTAENKLLFSKMTERRSTIRRLPLFSTSFNRSNDILFIFDVDERSDMISTGIVRRHFLLRSHNNTVTPPELQRLNSQEEIKTCYCPKFCETHL